MIESMLGKDQYSGPEKYEARVYLNAKFKTNPKSAFRWTFEHFPRKERLAVLELGCGTGLFWRANRDAIPANWSITLSDYSEGMLERTRGALAGIDRNFSYEVVDAEHIPFHDGRFDLVLANNMLYHVANRPATIGHVRRVLRDDGVFIAATMGRDDMREMHLLLYDFLDNRGRSFRFRELPFSLDNGKEQLEPFFPTVTMKRYENRLEIDEADPVVRYYLSINGMHRGLTVLPEEYAPGFGEYLGKILAERKVISVTKDAGIFICAKTVPLSRS